MLRQRLIFGPIMIACLLGVLILDNVIDRIDVSGTFLFNVTGEEHLPAGLLMLLVFLVIILLASKELVAIFHLKDMPADRTVGAIAGMTGCVMMFVIPFRLGSQPAIGIIASLIVFVFMLALFVHSFHAQRTAGAVAAGAAALFALIYMGVLPGFFLAIRRWHSAWAIAAIILITKSCDIGAYFTGRALGRHKLIPWLSPGKTWEGLFGGVAFASVAGLVMLALAQWSGLTYRWPASNDVIEQHTYDFPLWFGVMAGGLLGAIGQAGDLTASLFKRDAGIKDSGNTIPGFGGVIDVADSPIIAAPFAYWLLVLAHYLQV